MGSESEGVTHIVQNRPYKIPPSQARVLTKLLISKIVEIVTVDYVTKDMHLCNYGMGEGLHSPVYT